MQLAEDLLQVGGGARAVAELVDGSPDGPDPANPWQATYAAIIEGTDFEPPLLDEALRGLRLTMRGDDQELEDARRVALRIHGFLHRRISLLWAWTQTNEDYGEDARRVINVCQAGSDEALRVQTACGDVRRWGRREGVIG